MAIERAVALKQRDIDMKAAKAGSEFSALLDQGDREAAEAKILEARTFFDQAGELERFKIDVMNRLGALGGDIPIARYEELLGITATSHDNLATQTLPTSSPVTPPTSQEVISRRAPILPMEKHETIEDPEVGIQQSDLGFSSLELQNDNVPLSERDRLSHDSSFQPDLPGPTQRENEKSASIEAERVLPIVKLNIGKQIIVISENGKIRTKAFRIQDVNISFDFIKYFVEHPQEIVLENVFKKMLDAQRYASSLESTMNNLRMGIGDSQRTLIEALVTDEGNFAYRFNAVVQPWDKEEVREANQQIEDDRGDFDAKNARVITVPNRTTTSTLVEGNVDLQRTFDQPTVTIEKKPIPPLPTVESVKEEIRDKNDLSEREEKVSYSLLAVNEEGTDFAFPTKNEAIREAFSDMLDEIADPNARERREIGCRGSFHNTRDRVFSKLVKADAKPDNIPPHLAQLRNWTKSHPIYANLSMDDISQVLRREITFGELLKKTDEAAQTGEIIVIPVPPQVSIPESHMILDTTKAEGQPAALIEASPHEADKLSPQLSENDVYGLAKIIRQQGKEALGKVGVTLHTEDEQGVEEIVNKYTTEADEQPEINSERLAGKLTAFINNKQEVFMANMDSDDAQLLLALLASVDSEEKVRELLGAVPDVKKNLS